MILEVAILTIKVNFEKQFEIAFVQAQEIIVSMKGYQSHQLQKCIEINNRYILLVQWHSLQDHIEGFRKSQEYQQWIKLLHHFYEPFPEVEHYQLITEDRA